jgi:hypothetical protein
MRLRLAFLLAIVGLSSFSLLSNSCGTADEIFDCQAVCTRYRDCYDLNYDVGACRNRCKTASDNDPAVRRAADDCEACIGDRSCISATFACQPACGTIIAQ